jgi:putative oxidoreductase
MKPVSRQDIALLILRVGAAGSLFFAHGWSKISHFSERANTFSDPLHLGSPASLALVVFAEIVCSALVGVGLLARWAVIPILVFLLVAIFIQHAADPWPRKELPLLYLLAFIPVLLLGPGRLSIDAMISKRRPSA